MFGHEDDQSGQQDSNQIPDQSIDAALSDETTQAAPAAPVTQTVQPTAPSAPPMSAPPSDMTAKPLGSSDAPAADVSAPAPSPAAAAPAVSQPDQPVTDDAQTDSEPVDQNTLIDIKQQALSQLSPLLGHLDQSPEEKFRTYMMMIQASDNQSLLKTAFAAAQNITDEQVRAQALLDVVNEINYFTQHEEGDQ